MSSKKIIVALDSDNMSKTLKLVRDIKNEVFGFKIGYEFFYNFGISGYIKVKNICPKIFLDLKLHDIPNTVNKGIKALNNLNPTLATIHISGGENMMKATSFKNRRMKIIGVSVLTSLSKNQIKKYYNENNIEILIKKFVKEAIKCKLDGIVCSPKEIEIVKKIAGNKLLIITPGIRPTTNKIIKDDQKRTMSPEKAIKLGADLLVIGRPITRSKNPLKKIKKINNLIIK